MSNGCSRRQETLDLVQVMTLNCSGPGLPKALILYMHACSPYLARSMTSDSLCRTAGPKSQIPNECAHGYSKHDPAVVGHE